MLLTEPISNNINELTFTPFQANVSFLYPLEKIRKIWFSGVFKGIERKYKKRNGFVSMTKTKKHIWHENLHKAFWRIGWINLVKLISLHEVIPSVLEYQWISGRHQFLFWQQKCKVQKTMKEYNLLCFYHFLINIMFHPNHYIMLFKL